ncbi:hypothetical protein BD311DRAFT_782860 [Dichomitus squalens]|uniref:Uncharacterized protein n=1 Tax=Dichomitus squalens TaxID=114155 RepID=A0A4Q9M6T2_9APHY|nr:hypothetical protein BD311DRAFT_782860 [Dichomitus squalens]
MAFVKPKGRGMFGSTYHDLALSFKLQLSACDYDTVRFTNAELTPSLESGLEMDKNLSRSNSAYTDVDLRDAFMLLNLFTASTSLDPFDTMVYNPSHDLINPTHHTTRTMNPASRFKPSSAPRTSLHQGAATPPSSTPAPPLRTELEEMSPLSVPRPSETHHDPLAQKRIGRCALGLLRAPG